MICCELPESDNDLYPVRRCDVRKLGVLEKVIWHWEAFRKASQILEYERRFSCRNMKL
jgi:hypothetical protein